MNYQKLFSSLPETIVVLQPDSPDYRISDATDLYLKTTMRKREDLIGRKFLVEAFPDNSVPYIENPVRKSLDKALASKKVDYLAVIRYDIQKPEAEGGGLEERYWEASHTPILDEQGQVEYLIQRTTDVTERELAKQAQIESEEKFKLLTDAIPQLIYITDPAGNLTYVNQRWVDYSGLTVDKAVNAGWQAIIHPDDFPAISRRMNEVTPDDQELQAELRLKNKDGHYRWYLTKSLAMLDKNNEVMMRVGSATDIHDSRQMVQELLQANEQMSALSDMVHEAYNKAEAERKTLERLIIESPAFFCILKGPEHCYDLVNQQYQNLFPNRPLLHKTVAEALPEVVEQGFVQILDKVYQTGETFIANEILVKLDRAGNGHLADVYLTFNYQPLYGGDLITGIIVFGYEVTDQVLFRNKLKELGFA